MNETPPRRRRLSRTVLLGVAAALVPSFAVLAKLETWRDEGASAFGKARREHVVVTDGGRVRLGHALKPTASLDAARVWDLAVDRNGVVYAATGDEGKVYRREAKESAPWTVAFDAGDTQVLSLAVLPDGRVFAGTGPSGQVVEVTEARHSASRPGRGVQYVWDLAADSHGNLYAATGPNGQLWKRSDQGTWSLLYDSTQAHLLCVAVGPDGSVYAGSDGEGLLYKVTNTGKIRVLHDAAQSEIRTLLLAEDGSIYAGTASESGGGSGRGPSTLQGGGFSGGGGFGGRGTEASNGPIATQDRPGIRPEAQKAEEPPGKPATPSRGGSATPRPPLAGENAVFRIDADGVAREVFRAKVLVFALAWRRGNLLVGTGPEGQLYEVNDRDHESTPLARLDSGHVLSLVAEPGGGVLIGTADPGLVVRLESDFVPSGTLTSDVRDTKLISRLGALSWRADTPPGTSVGIQVRSGNVAEPDATWSDWSTEQTDPGQAPTDSLAPPSRFLQYRARLATRDPSVTPELRSVAVRYQSANLAPEIARLEVPDVSAGDGATRQTRLTFKWEVTDPNNDDLSFGLEIRKEGWPGWVALNEQPLTDKSYAWDATSVPAGTYRVRLKASDRPSNNPGVALTSERISDPFLIDCEVPEVVVKPTERGASVSLRDRLTRIVKASYALDGGDWVPLFPDDGLFDTPVETLTVRLPDVKPGTHVLMVRATDAAGNVGVGDALLEVRRPQAR